MKRGELDDPRHDILIDVLKAPLCRYGDGKLSDAVWLLEEGKVPQLTLDHKAGGGGSGGAKYDANS